MAERDDGLGLGLSLSLKCPDVPIINPPPPAPAAAPAGVPLPMNIFRSPMPFFHQQQQQLPRSLINDAAFQLSSDRNVEPISPYRGFDMNRAVTVVGGDEEVMVSSPNSTVSSLSGKRSEREEIEGEMEEDCSDAARKKLRLSKEQGVILEEAFKLHNTLNPRQKVALAKQLNLRPRQVEVWFQNRRARTKLKQTEVDCEYLKRCCENLTDENRRLHKEVNELRALKMSPQFYMNMSPPTTLTMCPQCERVSSSSSAPTSLAIGPTPKPAPLARQAPPPHLRPMTMASWAQVIAPQPAQRPPS